MKIKINERFSMGSDEYNWILYDTHTFVSKKEGDEGQIKETTKIIYPSTLDYLCQLVIDSTPKSAGSMTEVLTAIVQAKQDLLEAIKKIPERHTKK